MKDIDYTAGVVGCVTVSSGLYVKAVIGKKIKYKKNNPVVHHPP